MRKQIAVMVLLISTLTMAAPALGSTTEVTRPATTATTISDNSADGADTQELRRFCAANPRRDRCVNQPVVNVRQMIWRLINAGEWRQLFQLLHRLGII